jgi:hypothetical protein
MVSVSLLFTLNTIVGLVFALGLLVIPEQLMVLYGAAPSPAAVYVARLFGALILGFITILWFSRNSEKNETRRAILMGGLVGWGVGLIVALVGQFSGVVNNLGWLNVVIYFLFALDFFFFLFVRKD